MKRLVLMIFLVITVTSCAQDKGNVIEDPRSGKPMLVGECAQEAFTDSAFSWWYESGQKMYEIDSATVDVKAMAGKIKDYDITVVLGTWCGDSRRELPRFIKMLEKLSYPMEQLKMICVDREMSSPGNLTEGMNIERVPTMIFYKNGEEKGRIIESPEKSLAEDTEKIIED